MAAEIKTKPTQASVTDFLDKIDNEQKKVDCQNLHNWLLKVTSLKALMWGESIVGYGSYTYTNTTGVPNKWPLVGFSPRKQNITIYIMDGYTNKADYLANLGKYKLGVSCLYIKKLADIDLNILETMVLESVAYMKSKYTTES